MVFKEFRGRFPWKTRKAGKVQGIDARFQGNLLVFFYISLFSENALEITDVLSTVHRSSQKNKINVFVGALWVR